MSDSYTRVQMYIILFLGSVLVLLLLSWLYFIVTPVITINTPSIWVMITGLFIWVGTVFAGLIMALSSVGFGQYLRERATERAEVT